MSVNGTLYWDVLRLFFEIKQGLTKAKLAGGFDSIGIDTWGVDFGLLDEFGCLLENPIHYRDARTAGMIEEVFKTVPREELYSRTGIQFMELNTLFQLCALKKYRPHILDRADKLLFMPDLFAYMLTGRKQTEYSIRHSRPPRHPVGNPHAHCAVGYRERNAQHGDMRRAGARPR